MLIASIALALALPAAAQSMVAPGMSAPGRISWDAEGVPTIDAANDNDAAFLQGYAHAKDRFFQMDLTRRSVSGSLAELVGISQLAPDVQARTLGLRRGAVQTWAKMSDDSRGWLRAYADGVNYWLAKNPLPPEYAALQLTHADPWTPVDSLCVGKGLAFQLSFDLDINPTINLGAYQQAGRAGGFDGSVLYFGDTHRIAPADNRVTVPGFVPGSANGTTAASAPAPKLASAKDAPETGTISAQTVEMARAFREKLQDSPLLSRALEGSESPIGSNEWVIAGTHTASGKAILSNDPHLGLNLPSVFMEQHVLSRDSRYPTSMDVTGVTVPGTPGVIQGCNQRVCWGTTTNSLDVTDVFQEQLVLNSYGLPYAIVHDGQVENLQWVFQNFYVNQMNGTPDSVTKDNSIGYTNGGVSILVPRRNNGALVSITGNSGLSVAYTGWGATFEIESFRRINRASNVAEFRDALSYFDFGSQNFAYADVDGNIAYFTSAEAPVRTDLQTENAPGGGIPPYVIRDGSGALKHDWMPVQNPQPNQAVPYEILPASEMPFVINPASGYFANANNDPIGFSLDNNPLNQLRPGGGIYYLDVGGSSAYRMGRIDRKIQAMIAAGGNITSNDMKALQANNQLMDAELVLPYLLNAYSNAKAAGAWSQLATLANDPRIVEAIGRLKLWDYSTPTGITAGYDAGDNPAALSAPSQAQVDASISASIYAAWRSTSIRNTIDATLTSVGLGSYKPGSRDAQAGFKFMLDNYAALGGKGASGLTFFAAAGAPDANSARDFVLLKSLVDGLDMLAGEGFSAAYAGSTNQDDYRWGKLHRIVFDHPLGAPFNIPGPNGYGFGDLSADLPGLARQGGFETVDAASHDARGNSVNGFMFGSGPARRFVGEMFPTISASEIIPGGQSGVLGSPLYVSQLGRWLTNQYHPLPIPAAAALQQPGSTVVSFVPL
ncbi:MAG TPA: penicillin acylase family protein [Dokdonella sp.]|uniref:penicillin acylase family protein n=1 Tax=Dokdonella sp. TaxID=2291710 RepID=UPI002D7E3908|nr:penicillin acylase family protein [Dokdonella sp.]HET9032321.1 penicillin acylase family protein [Dokdonella sp.]